MLSDFILLHDDNGEVLVRAADIFCAYRDPDADRTRIVLPGQQFHVVVREAVREIARLIEEGRAR